MIDVEEVRRRSKILIETLTGRNKTDKLELGRTEFILTQLKDPELSAEDAIMFLNALGNEISYALLQREYDLLKTLINPGEERDDGKHQDWGTSATA
jgi:hypothetical protein